MARNTLKINDLLTPEAQTDEISAAQALEDAAAAMANDPDFASEDEETEMNTALTVNDVALTTADAEAHVAAMRDPNGVAAQVAKLNAQRRGVTPVDARLGPDPHASKRNRVNEMATAAERNAQIPIQDRLGRTPSPTKIADSKAKATRAEIAKANAEPKEPKVKILKTCEFTGRECSGRFTPGGDAKMKSALVRRFRDKDSSVDVPSFYHDMRPELALRFIQGDLTTSEGAYAELVRRGWGHFATEGKVKAPKAAPSKEEVVPTTNTDRWNLIFDLAGLMDYDDITHGFIRSRLESIRAECETNDEPAEEVVLDLSRGGMVHVGDLSEQGDFIEADDDREVIKHITIG